jgi:hypothetical protein
MNPIEKMKAAIKAWKAKRKANKAKKAVGLG